MASFGRLVGLVVSRSQKFKQFIKPYLQTPVGVQEAIAGTEVVSNVVVAAARKFLTSFGKETQKLNQVSQERLQAQDPISQAKMRDRAVAEITARTKEDIKLVVERYSRGTLSLETLRTEVQSIFRASTLAVAVVGTVGVGNLTENVLTAVQRQLTTQFRLFDGFINELSTRELTQRDRARFLQYANSLHSISQTANRQFTLDTYGDPSNLEERRVLGGSDHCGPCIALAAEGWVPFGSLPPIGTDTYCKENCQCSIITRMKSNTDDQEQPVPNASAEGQGL